MRLWAKRTLLVLLGALSLGSLRSEAQLPFLSNVFIRASGVSVGYTTNETAPGTIRWNPSISNLQIFTGSGWTGVSTSVSGGSTGGTTIVSGFPLTSDVSAAHHSITNGGEYSASTGRFPNLIASNIFATANLNVDGNTTVNGLLSDGDVVVNGDLTVSGTEYINTMINHTTNINIGVTTTYVYQTIYSTQILYNTVITYTNIISTNTIVTYVNIGGTWDSSNAAWVATPHIYDPATNVGALRALGTWDFSSASITGWANTSNFLSGSQVSTAIQGWASTATTASFPLISFTPIERDPVFTNWLATTGVNVTASFTNTSDSAGKLSSLGGGLIGIGTNVGSASSTSLSNFFYRPPLRTNGYDIDFDTPIVTTNDSTSTNLSSWYVSLGRGAHWWQTNGALFVSVTPPSTGYQLSAISLPLPNPPYRFEMHMVQVAWSNLQVGGLALFSTNNGKALLQTTDRQAGAASYERISLQYWSSAWVVGNSALSSLYYLRHTPSFWAIENDGTNFFCQVSPDGFVWATYANAATSSTWGTSMTGSAGPRRVGYGWDWSVNSTTNANESVQRWVGESRWFRRIK